MAGRRLLVAGPQASSGAPCRESLHRGRDRDYGRVSHSALIGIARRVDSVRGRSEFGFGAETGISTQKMHARGLMGLPELTSTTYVGTRSGRSRSPWTTPGSC